VGAVSVNPRSVRGFFAPTAHQLLGARQDLKGGAMFWFALISREAKTASPVRRRTPAPAGKFRQEFYRKASPAQYLQTRARCAGFLYLLKTPS